MSAAPYFPLFVDLSGRRIAVIGGGAVATRRIGTLLPFGPEITVTAPEVTPALRRLAEEGAITWQARAFEPDDLTGADLVLAATDDRAVNERVGALCRQAGIPVNTADCRETCDFYFPGIIRREEMVIGFSASGTDHRRARRLRELTEESLERLREEEIKEKR